MHRCINLECCRQSPTLAFAQVGFWRWCMALAMQQAALIKNTLILWGLYVGAGYLFTCNPPHRSSESTSTVMHATNLACFALRTAINPILGMYRIYSHLSSVFRRSTSKMQPSGMLSTRLQKPQWSTGSSRGGVPCSCCSLLLLITIWLYNTVVMCGHN